MLISSMLSNSVRVRELMPLVIVAYLFETTVMHAVQGADRSSWNASATLDDGGYLYLHRCLYLIVGEECSIARKATGTLFFSCSLIGLLQYGLFQYVWLLTFTLRERFEIE